MTWGTADSINGKSFRYARSAKSCLKAVLVALIINLGANSFRVEVESARTGSAGKVRVGSSARSAAAVVVGVVGLALGADKPIVQFKTVRSQEIAALSLCNVVVAGFTLRRRTLTNSSGGVEDRLLAYFQAA